LSEDSIASIGELEQFACDNSPLPLKQKSLHQETKELSMSTKPTLDDYTLLKVLGKGSFGKVVLVRKKHTDALYAMKILSKPAVILRQQVEHTRAERNVLTHSGSPFIVSMHAAFQSNDKLYLVLDYCPGGELFFHLSRAGTFPERVTQFYAAELVMALEYLHSQNIVYRDMKPENVLLDAKGHVKLADFGLAKENVSDYASGCNSLCGTPEYLAPEVLGRMGHGLAVDWWGLGMLVYEMLTGLPPWYTQDKRQLMLDLRAAPLTFPPHVSEKSRAFVAALLVRNPSKRLGSQFGLDAKEVKQHPFFSGLDWVKTADRKLPVPIRPCKVFGSNEDVSNFSTDFTRLPLLSNAVSQGIKNCMSQSVVDALIEKEENRFDGFTYEERTSVLG
jgi:serine/threonine protein kinase